jgi:TolB protein
LMLVRAFRLIDKFANALISVLIWLGTAALAQLYRLRIGMTETAGSVWFTASNTVRSGRVVYERDAHQRRATMARRAAELSTRTVVREDPLRGQNRALSLFTVFLIGFLIVLVLWLTGNPRTDAAPPRVAGGGGLPLVPTNTPTEIPPTPTATFTPNPDPLRTSGTVVYTLRQAGRDNLWMQSFGQPFPVRLTDNDDRDPAFDPEGKRIAFTSRREGNWELYVMDVASRNPNRLTFSGGYEGSPSWSPDGAYIVYEAYENNNLDIYFIKADGTEAPTRITRNPAPDFSPSWSFGGREIAYVSLRDGNAEIYVINLNAPSEDDAVRMTNTPDLNEDFPAWSPVDQQLIAYSVREAGIEVIRTKSITAPNAEPGIIAQGRYPVFSPDGGSILYSVDSGSGSLFAASSVSNSAFTSTAFSVPGRARRMSWTRTAYVANNPPADPASLYTEAEERAENAPFFIRKALPNVTAPIPELSDRVDDSFNALRAAVAERVGFDFLGTLQDAAWETDRLPELGQPTQSWHYTGRAFAINSALVYNTPAVIEVVREDIGANIYWRVYIRVAEDRQDGSLGEPLKRVPWDFASRNAGDPEVFEAGGRPKLAVPQGYYVDFTQLAEDYGWTRVPSERDWRRVFGAILFWEYDKRDNLSWADAMLEIYTQQQINQLLSGPTPRPTLPSTATPGPRTPTPIPPDLGGSGG